MSVLAASLQNFRIHTSAATIAEWQASGLGPEWAEANTSAYAGYGLAETLASEIYEGGRSALVQGERPAGFRRLEKQYKPFEDGIVDYHGDLTLNESSQVKAPQHLYIDKDGKEKLTPKYQTLKGQSGAAMFPAIPPEHFTDCLLAACHVSGVKYSDLEVLPGDFWGTIAINPQLIRGNGEGLKKACAMTANGIPSIAARGNTMLTQKDALKEHHLRPEVAAFIEGAERPIVVALDLDPIGSNARKDTEGAIRRFTRLVPDSVRIVWDEQYKGVDDALAAGLDLKKAFELAPSPKARQAEELTKLRKFYEAQEDSSCYMVRETEGEYLPLMEVGPGEITGIRAPMGSGKTARIVELTQATPGVTIVFTPLSNLGSQTAKESGLKQIYGGSASIVSEPEIREKGGVVLCPNSFRRIPKSIRDDVTLIVFDEADKTLADLINGSTLKHEAAAAIADLWQFLREMSGKAAIVAAQAGLKRSTLELLAKMAGVGENIALYSHKRVTKPWDVRICSAIEEARARFQELMVMGETTMLVTASLAETRTATEAADVLGIVPLVISSDTNRQGEMKGFFDDPMAFIKEGEYKVVILSPSVGTGVSIGDVAGDPYFDEVVAVFSNLHAEAHLQMLGRCREAVRRTIFCAATTGAMAGSSYKGKKNAVRDLIVKYGEKSADFVLEGKDDKDKPSETIFTPAEGLEMSQAILEVQVATGKLQAAHMWSARETLIDHLEAVGHIVTMIDPLTKERKLYIQGEWKEYKAKAQDKEAVARAAAPAYESIDDIPKNRELSLQEEYSADKTHLSIRLPGIDLNDAAIVLQAQVENNGKMIKNAYKLAAYEDLTATKMREEKAAKGAMKGLIRLYGNTPKLALAIEAFKNAKALEYFDTLIEMKSYRNDTPELLAFHKLMQANADGFRVLTGYDFSEKCPLKCFRKALRFFGLDKAIVVDKRIVLAPGKRMRTFHLDKGVINPLFWQLVEAAKQGDRDYIAYRAEKDAKRTTPP